MSEDFSNFLHSQFSEAHENQQSPEEIIDSLNLPKDRYTNKNLLAEGGQKKIFKCTDSLTNRAIAYATIKDRTATDSLQKFIREARITAHLEHPNIIPVYDTGSEADGLPFFTMKLISGQSFEDYLSDQHSLNLKIDILIKICEAITYAHSKGIIHFDLKPENIQVSQFGEVLVCDWGLSSISYECCSNDFLEDDLLQAVDINQSLDSLFKGTPGYAAPEMSQRNTFRTHTADIYSLGAILWQILYKKKPEATPQFSAGQVPEALLAVCKKSLETDPNKRYQKCNSLLADLQSWRHGFATEAEQAGFKTQFKLLFLRHKHVSLSFLASILLITSLTIFFVSSLRQKEKEATKLAHTLQETEIARNILEDQLAPKYLQNAYKAFKERNYSSVRALCQHILRNNESPEARELIGFSYLSEQNFTKALPWLDKTLFELTGEFLQKTPLSTENLIAFISELPRKSILEQTLYKNLLFEEFEKDISIEEKKDLITAELLYKNQRVQSLNLTLKETSDGLIIDLSNNPKVQEAWILEKLGSIYIKSLNLSYTPVKLNQEIIDKLHIEELILKGWPKRNLSFLQERRILQLNVAHSKIDASTFIQKMPLKSLDISHSPFSHWPVLEKLKFLKVLTISKDQKQQLLDLNLNPQVEIIEN
jgi:eukaryotic-like serine/threonine-protein kinase